MSIRSKDSYETYLLDFMEEIFIVCPTCSAKAIVKAKGVNITNLDRSAVRIVCIGCGFSKSLDEVAPNARRKRMSIMTFTIGNGIDPYFSQPLWLVKKFGEHMLWVYNYRHLDFLEHHIQAKLRERNLNKKANRSLGSRLPKWMTSKKNRESVLETLKQLREK